MEHTIKCYRKKRLILKIECTMRYDIFIKQLKNGVIFYDTSLSNCNFEMVNLRNFDRVVVENEQHFVELSNKEVR